MMIELKHAESVWLLACRIKAHFSKVRPESGHEEVYVYEFKRNKVVGLCCINIFAVTNTLHIPGMMQHHLQLILFMSFVLVVLIFITHS